MVPTVHEDAHDFSILFSLRLQIGIVHCNIDASLYAVDPTLTNPCWDDAQLEQGQKFEIMVLPSLSLTIVTPHLLK